MKKIIYILCVFSLISLSCSLFTPKAPSPEKPAETAVQAVTEVPTQPAPTNAPPTSIPATSTVEVQPSPTVVIFPGLPVTFDQLNLVLPPGLATGASGTMLPPQSGENTPPWGITPGNIQLKLEGYTLQDKFHQPQLYVYPAQAYADMQSGAAESIKRLKAILADPGQPLSLDNLPYIPFFNAGQIFASNTQVIEFQNGKGVRMLTEYAQYYAPVNNHELIYHFEGLTNDGQTYVIAILPITAPSLQENSDPGSTVPAGGVAMPDYTAPEADMLAYYDHVSQNLNSTPPDAFQPSLSQLDTLVHSIQAGISVP